MTKRIIISEHLIVAFSSWISKILNSVLQLLTIRILLKYLNGESYAIYTVLISLVAWFNLAEFGLGNSIQNFISEARAKNESYNEKLKSTIVVAALVGFVAIFILFIFSLPLNNIVFSKYKDTIKFNTVYLIIILGIFSITNSIFSISYKVFYGRQKGYWANIFLAIASAISFIGFCIINKYNIGNGSLILAILVYILPQCLCSFIAFIKIGSLRLLKGLRNVNFKDVKSILLRSYKFAGFQFLSACTLQIDYIIMALILNPDEIINYNILSKVFSLIFFIYSAVLAALWPTVAELYNQGKWNKSESLAKRYILLGIGFVILCSFMLNRFLDLVIFIFSDDPNKINIHSITIWLFCIYYILRVWTDAFSMLLQSMNILKVFWIYVPIQAAISCIFQVFLSKSYGINGIVLGLIISFIVTAFWILPYHYIRIKTKYGR